MHERVVGRSQLRTRFKGGLAATDCRMLCPQTGRGSERSGQSPEAGPAEGQRTGRGLGSRSPRQRRGGPRPPEPVQRLPQRAVGASRKRLDSRVLCHHDSWGRRYTTSLPCGARCMDCESRTSPSATGREFKPIKLGPAEELRDDSQEIVATSRSPRSGIQETRAPRPEASARAPSEHYGTGGSSAACAYRQAAGVP